MQSIIAQESPLPVLYTELCIDVLIHAGKTVLTLGVSVRAPLKAIQSMRRYELEKMAAIFLLFFIISTQLLIQVRMI